MTAGTPGLRAYYQARALLRAKRRQCLKGVTPIPREPGKVLQFQPRQKEVE